MKKRPPFNQNAAIRGAIRRQFARSPLIREILHGGRREIPKYNKDGSKAKKPAVQYSCEVCLQWVSSSKISVDHIDPVVSVDVGFVDWNTFIDRLWCHKSNLQRICDDCHQVKTNKERFERAFKEEDKLISTLENILHSPAAIAMHKVITKERLKKFTKKKLSNPLYPSAFIERVNALKTKIGMKV